MIDTTTLPSLLDRVRRATGPDRKLDIEIGEFFGACDHSGPAYHRPYQDWAKFYTSSLDAVTALIQRELPDIRWTAAGPSPTCAMRFWSSDRTLLAEFEHEDECLCRLGAFLSALIARSQQP